MKRGPGRCCRAIKLSAEKWVFGQSWLPKAVRKHGVYTVKSKKVLRCCDMKFSFLLSMKKVS